MCIADCTVHQLRPAHFATHALLAVAVGFIPTGDHAGYGVGREVTACRDFAQTLLLVKIDGGFFTGAAARIQCAHLAGFGVMDQPEIITAYGGHLRIHDGQRCGRGNRCINRIAAVTQHLQAGLCRQVVGSGDHALGGGRVHAT
ncbi:hypothetical protein D3C81_1608700 [compost metagenome]